MLQIRPDMYKILGATEKSIDFSIDCGYYDGISLSITSVAEYQMKNAAEAVTAIRVMEGGDTFTDGIIRKGISEMRWQGRMETVLPGVPVMNLLQIGTVKVRFSVPEQEIAAIGADSRMRITVPALGDRTFQAGKIEKGAVANPATHTYDVRATLSNADGELLPGMVCRVEASPAGAAEEIALPVRAVQQAGDGSRFVWKVSGDSVVRTAVATGRLVNNAVTITAGIQAGDRIVTDGMQKIGQGSKVIAE